MHLSTDTVNLCNTVSFPTLYPCNKALEFAIVVPITFEVIVVDEKLQVARCSTISLEMLACTCHCCAHIVEVAEVVLPVGGIAAYVTCTTGLVALRAPESKYSLAIGITARDSLVDNIPSLNLALASSHHCANPLVHSPSKGV